MTSETQHLQDYKLVQQENRFRLHSEMMVLKVESLAQKIMLRQISKVKKSRKTGTYRDIPHIFCTDRRKKYEDLRQD